MINGTCDNIPSLLIQTADFLGGIPDLAGLPRLCSTRIEHCHGEGWKVNAQLGVVGPEEIDEIDAIRAWALALGGHVLLDDEPFVSQATGSFRTLTAIAALPGGVLFEVWTHVDKKPFPAPASVDLAAA